jgi:hypothetical protein
MAVRAPARVSPAAARRRKAQIVEARRDPAAFCEYVGELELADVHREWLKMWQHEPQSVTHSSVGLGKSTLARLFVLWLLGNDPEERVIWVGATQKQPRTSLASISAMIESPGFRSRLHHVFPKLRPGRTWRATEIEIMRDARASDADPSISVYGAFADSLLGSRGTTIVLDDLCTWANTLTEDGRTKTIEWLGSVFSRLTKAKVRIIAIGNLWHKHDALSDLVETKKFVYKKTPAYTIDENGDRTPTAPQCLPLDRIRRLEQQLGPVAAARMLQLEVASLDIGRFKSVWFKRALDAGAGLPFRPERVRGACFTGVDFGHTKKLGSDRTSMVTCMVLEDGRRLIVDVRSGRWDTTEIRQNLREIHLAYAPIIGVESNGGQQMVAELVSEILAIPLIDKHTGVNKYHYVNGIEGLANELAQGFWIFPSPKPLAADANGIVEPSTDQLPGAWSLEGKAGGQPHREIQELIDESLVYDPAKHTGDRLMAWWICADTLRTSATGALLGQAMLEESPSFDWMGGG